MSSRKMSLLGLILSSLLCVAAIIPSDVFQNEGLDESYTPHFNDEPTKQNEPITSSDVFSNKVNYTNGTDTTGNGPPETISTLWYLVCFGGLVTFFLIVSVTEFCCKFKPVQQPQIDIEQPSTLQPPPPPYSLFAPPNYDSLFDSKRKSKKLRIKEIIHVFGSERNFISANAEPTQQPALEFGEVIIRNPMGEDEVVTPPPPP